MTEEPDLKWPPITRAARPWTRWWWHGIAVDAPNISRLLTEYGRTGLGGVEITPIYGVQGTDEREIPYLSPEWIAMLRHTLAEADRLDLGVDMVTGTGWPFGGPWVRDEDTLDKLTITKTENGDVPVYEASFTWAGRMVKRPAPGGEVLERVMEVAAQRGQMHQPVLAEIARPIPRPLRRCPTRPPGGRAALPLP
jgi:hypothetical protein